MKNDAINRYEAMRAAYLKMCIGRHGDGCPIFCPFLDNESGCKLKMPEYVKQPSGLNALAADIHQNAVDHGWWDDERTVPEILMLCVSELSEALEEYRNGKPILYCEDIGECACADCMMLHDKCPWGHKKPEGLAVELADTVIRVLDYCGYAGIDIDAIVRRKHEYNKTRPYKHGGKRC